MSKTRWQEINEGLTPRNITRMAGEPWVRWGLLPLVILGVLGFGLISRFERETARPALPEGPHPVQHMPLDVDWIRVTGSRTAEDARRLVPGGGHYRGGLEQNLPQGQGTFIWPDGSRYRGAFMDGRPHGDGSYTWRDGTQFRGRFEQGQPTGRGDCLISGQATPCRYRPGHLEPLDSRP